MECQLLGWNVHCNPGVTKDTPTLVLAKLARSQSKSYTPNRGHWFTVVLLNKGY